MPIGFDLQSQLIADAELKYLAQKSFISYLRSVHLKADKQVNRALPRLHEAGRLTGRGIDQSASLRASQIFDVQALSAHAKVYSESLGLLEPPKVLKHPCVAQKHTHTQIPTGKPFGFTRTHIIICAVQAESHATEREMRSGVPLSLYRRMIALALCS
jgi:hypothetical protein